MLSALAISTLAHRASSSNPVLGLQGEGLMRRVGFSDRGPFPSGEALARSPGVLTGGEGRLSPTSAGSVLTSAGRILTWVVCVARSISGLTEGVIQLANSGPWAPLSSTPGGERDSMGAGFGGFGTGAVCSSAVLKAGGVSVGTDATGVIRLFFDSAPFAWSEGTMETGAILLGC
jgi:hypothetical protein